MTIRWTYPSTSGSSRRWKLYWHLSSKPRTTDLQHEMRQNRRAVSGSLEWLCLSHHDCSWRDAISISTFSRLRAHLYISIHCQVRLPNLQTLPPSGGNPSQQAICPDQPPHSRGLVRGLGLGGLRRGRSRCGRLVVGLGRCCSRGVRSRRFLVGRSWVCSS